MKPAFQVALGLAATIGLAIAVWYAPGGEVIELATVGLLSVASLIFRRRLPPALRVFATGGCFHMTYSCFLFGRTMHPGFSFETLPFALYCFVLLGSLPAFSMALLWDGRIAARLLVLLLPVGFAAAEIVA